MEKRGGKGKGRKGGPEWFGGWVWGLGLGVGKRQKHSGHSGEEEAGPPETNGSWSVSWSGTSLGLSGTTSGLASGLWACGLWAVAPPWLR